MLRSNKTKTKNNEPIKVIIENTEAFNNEQLFEMIEEKLTTIFDGIYSLDVNVSELKINLPEENVNDYTIRFLCTKHQLDSCKDIFMTIIRTIIFMFIFFMIMINLNK